MWVDFCWQNEMTTEFQNEWLLIRRDNVDNQIVYQHLNLLDHSILLMKGVRVQIKIYHLTNNTTLST